jgi:uncharacterized protein (TIGR03435 family)
LRSILDCVQNKIGESMKLLLALPALLASSGIAIAQSAPLTFEVSSIKPSSTDEQGKDFGIAPGGRLTMTNATLKEMILFAWQMQPFQISGAKGWIDSERYDLVAVPKNKAKEGETQLMLRVLLAERFGLIIHSETKEIPIYALVMAKRDGRLGPGLMEFKEGSCTEFDLVKAQTPPEQGQLPTVFCGRNLMGRNWIRGSGIPLADLANTLSRRFGRLVVDETGLTGKYDVNLQWTPDPSGAVPADGPKPPPFGDSGPDIFTAVTEQLGLKLESKKRPAEILVIDKAARPDGN